MRGSSATPPRVYGQPSAPLWRRSCPTRRSWTWTIKFAHSLYRWSSNLHCRAIRGAPGRLTRLARCSSSVSSLRENLVSVSIPRAWGRILRQCQDLLYLHRNYLAEAIRAEPDNPLSHRFGGSVMAAYRGAVRMCVTLRDLYRVHPVWTGRIWYFWSGVFSSSVRTWSPELP